MSRLLVLLSACSLMMSPAFADDAAEFSDALGKAVTGATLADVYMAACHAQDPANEAALRDAMAGWAHRVGLAGYRRLLVGAGDSLPDFLDSVEQHAQTIRPAIDREIAADDSACEDFSAKLGEEVFDIQAPIRYLLRNADNVGIVVADPPVLSPTDEVEIVPLTVLSAQLADKMEEVGSKSGARDHRDLREAREEHATAWLRQRPALVVFGRVVEGDSVREWRGDQQSSFRATCHSFADDGHEASMERDRGEDRIVLGEVRWLLDEREGGTIGLRDCRIFVHDAAEAELASMADDSAGLMLRPLEYDEAFAGPGKGIAMSDVDRVLYDGVFENRMDGFGNGYTHRNEDIYVLLRDGTAYRHEWSFAFTDLDVNLSRRREPERWFTWRNSRGTLTVTRTGGLDAGEEIDLSDARVLMPVPRGQTLDRTYYYLNVGMGGFRSDRDYAFSADGQLVHTRGGFVAGNFGTHYITVVGDDDDVATSAYTFDGYTLLVDGPDGQERHFVAIFEGDEAGRPEEIIIDGQVHWLRKEEE